MSETTHPSSRQELRRRLARGIGATALNPIITAIIQLGTVPVLLHAWGAAKYGDWLILSAVPSYLSLTNLGFGDASGSDMTMRVASGDRRGALETFHSSWVLLLIASALLLTIVSSIVWWIPWQRWTHLSTLPDRQAAFVILVLSLYIVIGQQCGVIESGFRCDGNFATGTLWGAAMRLAEAIVGCLAGVITDQILYAAAAYLVARTAATLGYAALLRKRTPWLSFGFKHARVDRVKALSVPALGFVALPLGYSIGIQGFTLMIAFLRGPLAVTIFSTLRTLTRLNFQLMTTIGWALWPELSAAFGSGKIHFARNLHRRIYQVAVTLLLFTTSLLWFTGPIIYHAWIRNAVSFEGRCFHILLIVTFLNSLWFMSSVIPMSANAHHRLTLHFLAASLISLLIAWPLVTAIGVSGAAVALLFAELWMTCVVLRASLRQVQDSLADFLRARVKVPHSWELDKLHEEV